MVDNVEADVTRQGHAADADIPVVKRVSSMVAVSPHFRTYHPSKLSVRDVKRTHLRDRYLADSLGGLEAPTELAHCRERRGWLLCIKSTLPTPRTKERLSRSSGR